jgi:hypothetical protein
MNRILLAGIALFLLTLLSMPGPVQAQEQERPIQLALVSPVQIFPPNYSITGIRINLIYGKNTHVSGLDWGLINHTTSGKSMGINWGGVNLTDADFTGLQGGWVNIVGGDFEGFQYGFFNQADFANGLQLGFVNYVKRLKGLQIGLVNVIKQGGQFPIFPIVNWSF